MTRERTNEPIATNASSSYNVHRLVQESPGRLVLEPGPKLKRWAIGTLAVFPVLVVGAYVFRPDTGLAVWICLLPLFGGAAFTVGHFAHTQFGTRVLFDLDRQIVAITGHRHGVGIELLVSQVVATQFCEAGYRACDEGGWNSYQVNLVVEQGDESKVNLLDCGDKSALQKIAKQISEFLQVPLYDGVSVKSC